MSSWMENGMFRASEGADPAAGMPGGGGGTAVAPAPSALPEPVAAAPVDANAAPPTPDGDLFGALEQAMAAELPPDAAPVDPNAPPVAAEPQIPPEFAQALQISDFVREPAHVEQAIRAADEVWKVASGQAPASSMLEGIRSANPQAFESIIQNLVPYIEQITGQRFGGGEPIPPDPNQARLDAIEQKIALEEQSRQTQVWNQQVFAAREKAVSFLTEKSKGTFVEGMEQTVLQMVGAKAGIPEQQMVEMLLSGKTEKLEAAYKAVTADLAGLVKQMNANLIKKHRTLANAVPAVKGSNGAAAKSDGFDAYLPGETPVQYATRQFNKGR